MRNKRRNRAAEGEETDTNSWMVTFSDLSTLLLTFFVLLLSMSSMNKLKIRSMFHNFTSSCGVLSYKEYEEIARPKESLLVALAQTLKDTMVVKRNNDRDQQVDLTFNIRENILRNASGSLVYKDVEGGFKLVFGQNLLFDSGKAEIKDRARPILARIARFIRITNYQIYIDGFTDNVPIHTKAFPSNSALSLARAYAVMDYLVREEKLPPESIAIAGYGASRPVAANDIEAGRAKNRRVEMIFKNQRYF